MYLTTTRPELMFTVSLINSYIGKPIELQFQAAKRVLSYLSGTVSFGIFYNKGKRECLVGYIDSDYAGDLEDRNITSEYVFMLGFGAMLCPRRSNRLLLYLNRG